MVLWLFSPCSAGSWTYPMWKLSTTLIWTILVPLTHMTGIKISMPSNDSELSYFVQHRDWWLLISTILTHAVPNCSELLRSWQYEQLDVAISGEKMGSDYFKDYWNQFRHILAARLVSHNHSSSLYKFPDTKIGMYLESWRFWNIGLKILSLSPQHLENYCHVFNFAKFAAYHWRWASVHPLKFWKGRSKGDLRSMIPHFGMFIMKNELLINP